ncbi:chaperone protein DnaJ-like [Macadamia integrifolia]|uniref:chaperone protein DnaJ-like n=1 Tax=Macadamia integrifolia TaxID=60698 RepID=UPI001C4E70BA|nr:chaperone protein DnaJ-like [Macadamia integrifolia]
MYTDSDSMRSLSWRFQFFFFLQRLTIQQNGKALMPQYQVSRCSELQSMGCSELAVKFKELAQAYEVLRDLDNRQIYDQYGEDALKEGMGGDAGAQDPFDIFQSFFGGGGSSRGRRQRRCRTLQSIFLVFSDIPFV